MNTRTICNPINLNYRYVRKRYGREAADPAVCIYKDEYYLFPSLCEGYYVSGNLVDWEYIRVDLEKFPQFDSYAPATCVVGDKMYITHSDCGNIMVSDNPRDPDSWITIGKPYDWYDPSMLYDEGYMYVYEGLECNGGLSVCKLDPNDNMKLVEGPVRTVFCDRKNRGHERRGNNNENDTETWFEGPWAVKHNGKYYLFCAAPGTEHDTYANSCFVADAPMGPFEYCENSPVTFKSTGFLRGCGHGCVFRDLQGKWWSAQTNAISVNHPFERRVSLYPATFTEDGKFYSNTLRSDYPMLYPTDNPDPFNQPTVDWHILSRGKKATASSTLDEAHAPNFAADEYMASWWSAKTADVGEWLALDLGKVYTVTAVQVNFADQGVVKNTGGRSNVKYGYQFVLEVSDDGENWRILVDRSENEKDMPHDYIQLEEETYFRHIRITNCGNVPAGSLFAISDLRVFGPASGDAPEKAPEFKVVRGEDTRDMFVTIDQMSDAQGYYIRLGIDPNELYTHYLVTEKELQNNTFRVGCLNSFSTYYVTVDAFNEGGVTSGTKIIKL